MKKLFLFLSLLTTIKLASMAPAGLLLESGGMMNIEVAFDFAKQESIEVVPVPKEVANQFGVFTDQMSDSLLDKTAPLAAMVEPSAFKKLLALVPEDNLGNAIKQIDHSILPSVLNVADFLLLDENKVDLIIGEVAELLGEIGIDGLLTIAPPIQGLIIKKWLEDNRDRVSAAGCPVGWNKLKRYPYDVQYCDSVDISGDGRKVVVLMGGALESCRSKVRVSEQGASDDVWEDYDLGDFCYIRSVAISGNGERLIVNKGHRLELWDLETRKQPKIFKEGEIQSAAISEDGKIIALMSNQYDIVILDLNGSSWSRTVLQSQFEISSIAMSADGKKVIALGGVSNVFVWGLAENGAWNFIRTLFCGTEINSIAISGDGKKIIASGYSKSLMWDIGEGGVWRGPKNLDGARSVAISKKGNHVVFGECNRSLGRHLDDQSSNSFDGHAGWVSSIATSDNYGRVISADNRRAILWNYTSDEDCQLTMPIVYAIEMGKDLTPSDKKTVQDKINFDEIKYPGLIEYLEKLGISQYKLGSKRKRSS